MSEANMTAAIARLKRAASTRTACAPVRDLIGGDDLDAAYTVQRRQIDARVGTGRRIVGRKIGLTAPAVQRQLGVSQPDFGALLDDMEVLLGAEVDFARLLQPKCEAEIAFVINSDLDGDGLTIADVISGIDYMLPAIEIVDSRIAGWDITIADTVADNASSGLFVLGHDVRRVGEVDLRQCGMALEQNGEVVSTGAGAACLGSPINALHWLAREMHQRGTPLRKNQIVLSGALGPMVAARPGDCFHARINGLGEVSCRFGGGLER